MRPNCNEWLVRCSYSTVSLYYRYIFFKESQVLDKLKKFVKSVLVCCNIFSLTLFYYNYFIDLPRLLGYVLKVLFQSITLGLKLLLLPKSGVIFLQVYTLFMESTLSVTGFIVWFVTIFFMMSLLLFYIWSVYINKLFFGRILPPFPL